MLLLVIKNEIIQTKFLIDIDRLIDIGNTYIDGKFYDNNIEILTEKEILYKQLADYEEELVVLDAALLEAKYQNLIRGL